ncbi:unnamed protein product [Urochloa humidicola]
MLQYRRKGSVMAVAVVCARALARASTALYVRSPSVTCSEACTAPFSYGPPVTIRKPHARILLFDDSPMHSRPATRDCRSIR